MLGEAGFEKPQDCRVVVRLKEKDGITVKIHSKLEKMFGYSMKKSVEEELGELGIGNAEVEVFDFSSLDYVIRARVKTAVERARKKKDD